MQIILHNFCLGMAGEAKASILGYVYHSGHMKHCVLLRCTTGGVFIFLFCRGRKLYTLTGYFHTLFALLVLQVEQVVIICGS